MPGLEPGVFTFKVPDLQSGAIASPLHMARKKEGLEVNMISKKGGKN